MVITTRWVFFCNLTKHGMDGGEEEWQRNAKKDKMRANVLEKDSTSCMDSEADYAVDLSVYKLIDVEVAIES